MFKGPLENIQIEVRGLFALYADEALAQIHAENAIRETKRLEVESKAKKYYLLKADEQAKIWDPNMRFDYTGTDYTVIEVEVREELP